MAKNGQHLVPEKSLSLSPTVVVVSYHTLLGNLTLHAIQDSEVIPGFPEHPWIYIRNTSNRIL